MLGGRMGIGQGIPDNPLSLSWHDSAWIPILNTTNVLEYFSERSNPFYDRTCNNELVKMQRLAPEQLQNMTGLEYVLLHVQEPILYVIRKQHRHTPQQVTPLNDYYIIAGVVYQAPDLASVLNSRLLSTVHHLLSSFEEASSFARYHPSKGYSWDFKSAQRSEKLKKEEKVKDETSSLFQRQRVDNLLCELIKKFPIPAPSIAANMSNANAASKSIKSNATANFVNSQSSTTTNDDVTNQNNDVKNVNVDIKTEKVKPPPEKKPRIV